MTSPIIHTPRLRLEPLDARHVDALYRIYQDPEVSRFLITRPADRAEFEPIFQRALSCGASHGMWAVFVGDSRELAGRVGYFTFGAQQRPELAYLLATRFWGRGLATEAARAALEHGFSEHRWAECVALIRPENGASIRVAEKLGMRYEAAAELNGLSVSIYRVAREACTS